MSKNVEEYCELMKKVHKMRIGKYNEIDEDLLLNEMDELWMKLNDTEINQVEEFAKTLI